MNEYYANKIVALVFIGKQDRGGQRCVLKPLFIFNFFTTFSFFIFFLQLFHSLRHSFILVDPFFSSLLPPRPSFFLVQHRLNHSESVKIPFFINFDKSITNRQTNRPTDKWTRLFIEMGGRKTIF